MIVLIIVMNIFLALTFTLSKCVIQAIHPLWFIAVRATIVGILFGIWYIVDKKPKNSLSKRSFAIIVALGLLNVYVMNVCQLWSLQTLSAAKVSLLFSINPFIILILGYLFLYERISIMKLIGLIFGWAGMTFFLLYGTDGTFDYSLSWGELWIIVAAIATAISALLLQKIMRAGEHHLSLTKGFSMLIGALIASVHGLMTTTPMVIDTVSGLVILAVAAVTIATMVCAALYAHLITIYNASFISFTCFLAPLFAVLFDWLLFGSMVPWSFFVAMSLIAIGLYLFYQDDVCLQKM